MDEIPQSANPSASSEFGSNAKIERDSTKEERGGTAKNDPVWKKLLSHRWGFAGVSLAVSLGFMLVLSGVRGLPWDAATVALACSLAALLVSLRSLWSMVETLSDSREQLVHGQSGRQRWNSRAAIREEKNRVLRALKELDFDHSMGKLAESDYVEIRDRYRLRAVQAIRALEQDESLHPDLQQWLEKNNEQISEPQALVCSACSLSNDCDAKFCKACGNRLQA